MKGKICGNCKYYARKYGVCVARPGTQMPTMGNWYCPKHEQGNALKVKPRRLCDFCERGKRMESEEGEHDLRLVKLTPLPAINLTSGETAEKAEPPYYAMFLNDAEDGDEAATFPIKFCPFCGRKLVSE